MKGEPRNNAVYAWNRSKKQWELSQRFFDPREALTKSKEVSGIVIDLLSGKMTARNGVYCSRARPAGIGALPDIEKWTDSYKLELPDGAVEIMAVNDADAAEQARDYLKEHSISVPGLSLYRYPKEYVNKPTLGLIEVPFYQLK